MKNIITLSLLLFTVLAHSQKKKIDHTTYDEWKSIAHIQQSPSGQLISYSINPHKGDGTLFIRLLNDQKRAFPRGEDAILDENDQFVVFVIKNYKDSTRQLKLEKAKKSEFPDDSLAVYWPASDSVLKIPQVNSFQLAKNGSEWLAYLSTQDERPVCPKKKKCRLFRKKNKCERPETSGTTLHLLNLKDGSEVIIHKVVDYQLDPNGSSLLYTTSHKGERDSLSLQLFSLQSDQIKLIMENQLSFKHLIFDDQGERLAFCHSLDTNKNKNYSLSTWEIGAQEPSILGGSTQGFMPSRMNISAYYRPRFSDDGKRLFFGIAKLIEPEPEDTLLESEKATLDIWSGNDLRIQPQQLLEKRRDERKTRLAFHDFETKTSRVLTTDKVNQISVPKTGKGRFTLGYNQQPYQRERTWAFPWKQDVYLVDLETGKNSLLEKGVAYPHSLSPSGKHFIWYNGADSSWYSKNTQINSQAVNLTAEFDAVFASDVNGGPYVPYPEGSAGWFIEKQHEFFMVYSEYDIYAICPTNPQASFCLTDNVGQTEKVIYRYQRFDFDSLYTNPEEGLILFTNEATRSEGYAQLRFSNTGPKIERLVESDHSYIYVSKAEKSNQILYRKMSFTEYPELVSTDRFFEKQEILTHTNPQQKEYNWGTVEMVNWTSFKGLELRGLLYKPEDFDSTKSYPMIVYFYEKYIDRYHAYYSPKPTASIVYPTEYVSNDYIIFIPDIEYTPGHPAASAFDCIVSGTDYLTEKHSWIDTNRLGLQGQSWGGYQTAQLITMTDKYAAAMAGAPVSNMFSAYGGVRWGSGLSRMFQYERTQSRIGYTIWEKPELYIENSPLFGLPNVQTPLLIMHNDGDGAVPWYQGIELYMGLRRLDQPVWLLNYNGDEHNLMQDANRRDLSRRMRQFFDYYLLGAPIPQWMDEGVPAINKGIDYGFGLKNDHGN